MALLFLLLACGVTRDQFADQFTELRCEASAKCGGYSVEDDPSCHTEEYPNGEARSQCEGTWNAANAEACLDIWADIDCAGEMDTSICDRLCE